MCGKQLVLFGRLEPVPKASITGEALLKIAAPMCIKLPFGILASKCIPSASCSMFHFFFLTGPCKPRLSLNQPDFSDPLIWHFFLKYT